MNSHRVEELEELSFSTETLHRGKDDGLQYDNCEITILFKSSTMHTIIDSELSNDAELKNFYHARGLLYVVVLCVHRLF